jgi:hypothetical protein
MPSHATILLLTVLIHVFKLEDAFVRRRDFVAEPLLSAAV